MSRDLQWYLMVVVVGCTARTTLPVMFDLGVSLTASTSNATAPPSERTELVPWTLTASDGSGLVLSRVSVKGVVEGPLALTELELYFENDEDRVREGTFQITLPAGAVVSRFAMENAGQWMEAEVVEKMLARRAYDDFLHRKQDPALLEKAAGNQFTAKVFPIAAKSDKHLVISYFQELPDTAYVLPLRGLPKIGQLDIEVAVSGAPTKRLSAHAWQPDHDFVIPAAGTVAITAGTLVAAAVEVGDTAPRDVPTAMTILVDTSASRAGFDGYITKLRALVAELGTTYGDLPIELYAFDQETVPVFSGRAKELGEAQVRALIERGAAGASDLGQALDYLASRALRSRVVVVTDAVITAGVEGAGLDAKVQRLGSKVDRLDVVLAGGLRDQRAAARLVHAGLPHTGAVLDLDAGGVAQGLGSGVLVNLAVEVPGARWSYPKTIAHARAGTSAMVFAKLDQPRSTIEVVVGGKHRTLRAVAGTAQLVEHAIAGAEVAKLEGELAMATGTAATALRQAIVKQSIEARVLSSETSLLVLETDADYARYGIDRSALPDILTVEAGGVRRVHRSSTATLPPRPTTPPAISDTAPMTNAPTNHVAAPVQPESINGTEQVDNDHDGILDDVDGCPDDRATSNDPDGDGCPGPGPARVIVSNSSLVILEPIHFDNGRDVVGNRNAPTLDAVAQTMIANPDISMLEVQGHTDERGDDAKNLELSTQRAETVTSYLVAKGVRTTRLRAQGYGETQPIDRAHTEVAWARNRRVDFLILQRTVDGVTTTAATLAPPVLAPAPVTGELAEIEAALAKHDLDGALARARDWHTREPGNVLALIGLGEALEARKADTTAARVYGSIIDLFPGRADLRRFAGERLVRLSRSRDLAIDTFRRAVADRPDHMTGHRLLAYALLRAGKPADAFAAILAGVDGTYRGTRGGERVLAEDAGMIGAVYATQTPAKRDDIRRALEQRELALATAPSTRFVLYWETDANDVDFHITDAKGNHAFFKQMKLASGGELYADVTTGYGPECFTIPGTPAAGPYALAVDYYSRGPMGYGMGLLEIQTFDPAKGLAFDDRPYVIMNDRAKLALGTF